MLIVNRDGTVRQETRSTMQAQGVHQVSAAFRHDTAWVQTLISSILASTGTLVLFRLQERRTQLPTQACVA